MGVSPGPDLGDQLLGALCCQSGAFGKVSGRRLGE